jgi:spore maturation protein CgeB
MAQIWPWAVGGLRERLTEQLRKIPGAIARISYDDRGRRTPSDYHAILAVSTINVAPAGQGYFTNRLFETLAAGCALVAESPTMTFPGALVEPLEWRTFRNELEAADIVRELLADPDATREIAEAGQAALLERHTTRHRAETVWRSIWG